MARVGAGVHPHNPDPESGRGEGKPLTHTASLKEYVGLFLSWFVCNLIYCDLSETYGVVLLQLRRERIAERMKALQELVPNANKVN